MREPISVISVPSKKKLRGAHRVRLSTDSNSWGVGIAYQPTGYGEKPFFVCPVCGARRTKLYIGGNICGCRECLNYNPYNGIQNTTKGGYSRMYYTIHKMLGRYGIELDMYELFAHEDISYYFLEDRRPAYMRKAAFADLMGRVNVLADLRVLCISGISRSLPFYTGYTHIDGQLVSIIEKAPPATLMQFPKYRNAIERAEEIYNVPIRERLLGSR